MPIFRTSDYPEVLIPFSYGIYIVLFILTVVVRRKRAFIYLLLAVAGLLSLHVVGCRRIITDLRNINWKRPQQGAGRYRDVRLAL